MNRAAFLLIVSLMFPTAVRAGEQPLERLAFLVGDWTIEGSESSFREVCDFFPGRSHVVCNSESRRATATSRGVSVLSYSEEKKRYLYYHYGSSGVVVAMDVFTNGASLVATRENVVGSDVIREQVWMTPLEGQRFEFKEQTSKNGGPWELSTKFVYVRRPASDEKSK